MGGTFSVPVICVEEPMRSEIGGTSSPPPPATRFLTPRAGVPISLSSDCDCGSCATVSCMQPTRIMGTETCAMRSDGSRLVRRYASDAGLFTAYVSTITCAARHASSVAVWSFCGAAHCPRS